MTVVPLHRTALAYNAGTRTYHVVCETCGRLPKISLSRKEAEAKGAAHRASYCASCAHAGTVTTKRTHALAFQTSELIRRKMLAP